MDPYTEGNIAFKAFFSFFLKRDNFPARYDHMFLLLFVFSAYQKAHNGRQFRGFSRVQSTKFPYSFFFFHLQYVQYRSCMCFGDAIMSYLRG